MVTDSLSEIMAAMRNRIFLNYWKKIAASPEFYIQQKYPSGIKWNKDIFRGRKTKKKKKSITSRPALRNG